MASDHEDEEDFKKRLAEHSGTPSAGAGLRFPFPEYSAITEEERRQQGMFPGGSWYVSPEVSADSREVSRDAPQQRDRVTFGQRLRAWFARFRLG